ncbi:hypothetical protein PROVRETT_05389 [Providencia rettgeri DSM 1131]|nr:hypothetical protein PROVRETT_05389 [Providencia rettgeri DSM 1131]
MLFIMKLSPNENKIKRLIFSYQSFIPMKNIPSSVINDCT